MKKFIRNCMYILAIIILLSFILPSFIAKADTVTVSGKVTYENSGVKGIKVILCDSNGNPYDNGNYKAETKPDGEYSISVPKDMENYKLKFEYSGYKSAKAEQIGVKDYIHDSQKCKKLETRYVVPKEEKDTLEKRGIIKKELDKCGDKLKEENGYSTEEYWITYDANKVYDKNGNVSSDPLIETVKGIKTQTGLFPKVANIAIIIKATNNMPWMIDDIKKELNPEYSAPVKYKYFVLDSNNIFRNLNVTEERATICETEDKLIEEVCNYIGFRVDTVNMDITADNSKEGELITNTISNGESTKVNLTLGDKKEETQTPEDPNPQPDPDPDPNPDPNPEQPDPGDDNPPDPPRPDPDLPHAGTSSDITVKISYKRIEDTNESDLTDDYPVEISLEKTSPAGEKQPSDFENKKNNYIQTSRTNTYGLEYIEHELNETDNEGNPKLSTEGTYKITVIVGNYGKTRNKGFNGQNYDISAKIKEGGDFINGFGTNRETINGVFTPVDKDNALKNDIELTGTGIFYVENFNEPFKTRKEYEIEILLTERPKFELKVEQKISAAQMILSNGQILKSYKAGDGPDSGMLGDKIVWDVDDELKHGATVQIEYEITVKNTGDVDCTEFTLIDYLDYNNTSLQYRSDANLITENKKNSNYGWNTVSNFGILQNATKTELDEGKTYLQLKDGDGENTIIGKNGGKKTYKLLASTVITSELAIDNYQNAVEIISYKNAIGRVDRSATPGTYNPNLNVTNDNEHDSAKAAEVSIIPPTGTKQKWYTQLLETILNMFI